MRPSAPFDRHGALPGVLEVRARELARLAEEATDHQAVTDRAFQPAVASWEGVAAPELAEAPAPVREQVSRVASQLCWAAVSLRYWADQVRTFNRIVEELWERRDRLPAEVERYVHQVYGEDLDAWSPTVIGAARLSRHEELLRSLEQEWRQAFDTYIEEGERATVAMLAQGPTWEHLRLVREAGYLPAGAAVPFFAAEWERSAALAEAQRISGLILDGQEVTAEELTRLGEVLTRYGTDQRFAYEFLTELGPEGLLLLTATLGAFGRPDSGDQTWDDELRAVQAGLAVALATATVARGRGGGSFQNPYQPGEHELPPIWIWELTRAGRKLLLIDHPDALISQVYGYQALGVLLSHGGFDTKFLAVVGGDLIDFEREQGGSAFWTAEAPGHSLPFRLNWIHGSGATGPLGLDPMIGLLAALAEDPEAAKQVLVGAPPSQQGESDRLRRLDYLLTDREWPVDLPLDLWCDQHDDSRISPGIPALGRVLEVATTVDPDHRSYRIVESIIYEIARDEQAKGFPNGQPDAPRSEPFRNVDIVHDQLRPYLGRISEYYIREIHWITAGEVDASAEVTNGEGLRFSQVAQRDLQIFLAELGKNPEARRTILAAELMYAAEMCEIYLEGWDGTSDQHFEDAFTNVVIPTARLVAALDVGAASAHRAAFAEADAAHNEVLRRRFFWVEFGVSVATDLLPKGANTANHLGQSILDALEERFRHDSTGEANYYEGDLKEMTREILKDMIDCAAYEALTRELTPEEFLARVPPGDLDKVKVLLYLPGHPQEGEFLPIDEWEEEQFSAWSAFKTARGNSATRALEEGAIFGYDSQFNSARNDIEKELSSP